MSTIACPICMDAGYVEIRPAGHDSGSLRWVATCTACEHAWEFEDHREDSSPTRPRSGDAPARR